VTISSAPSAGTRLHPDPGSPAAAAFAVRVRGARRTFAAELAPTTREQSLGS
jgi:hypothetical protein